MWLPPPFGGQHKYREAEAIPWVHQLDRKVREAVNSLIPGGHHYWLARKLLLLVGLGLRCLYVQYKTGEQGRLAAWRSKWDDTRLQTQFLFGTS